MKTLSIQNFKCIKNLQINDLGMVNLFTGKNNTGKSTILEAISLYVEAGHPSCIAELLKKRGEVIDYKDDFTTNEYLNLLSSLFCGREISFDISKGILIGSEMDTYSICLNGFSKKGTDEQKKVENDKILKNLSYEKFDEIMLTVGGEHLTESYFIEEHFFKPRFKVDNVQKCYFVDTNSNTHINSSLWNKIAAFKEKAIEVIEVLRLIEPSIDGLSFPDDERNPDIKRAVVRLEGSNKLYPLKSMGDGVNRILSLILAMVNSDNGFLLIDEFENGLHYSVQEKLWEVIFMLSKKLNVQVFATTHSNDSVMSFAKTMQKSPDFDGALFRLAKEEDCIEVASFSEEEMIIAAQQNIELR